jgi:uncharacterized membrane protein YgcG
VSFRRTTSGIAVATFALAATLLPATAASAGVRSDTSDFTFSSFEADYYLSRDAEGHSTLRTVEKLTAVFPQEDQNRGITRAIPDYYRGVPLHPAFVSVSDTAGVTEPYSVDDDGTYLQVALGTDDYVHGAVTYTLTYTQENVAGAFSDTNDDEFYWDTNGTGWDQPFESVTARIHVDRSIAGALTGHASCYRGAQDSTDPCEIAQTTGPAVTVRPTATATATGSSPTPAPTTPAPTAADVVYTATTGALGANENMSVAVGFDAGTFVQVPAEIDPNGDGSYPSDPAPLSAPTPLWADLLGGLLLLAAVGGGIFAIVRRIAFGPRDAPGRGIIVPQYSVPKGYNLMEAAALINRPTKGIPAQIVSLAVRNNLHILDYPVTETGADFTLQFVTADGADPEEEQLLTTLFGPPPRAGAVREIVANNSIARALAARQAWAASSLILKGWRRSASSAGGVRIGLLLLAVFFVDIVFLVAGGFSGFLSGWAFAALPLSFVSMFVAFGVAGRRPVLTDAGAEQRDYLLGMRDYLQLAEADRLRMLQSPEGADRVDVGNHVDLVKLYEKLLPFAVLWGIEDEWSKVLAIHYEAESTSPSWYVSQNAFNSSLFASSLVGLSTAVAATATPVVTSSSSSWSGSSGGSFSGGSSGGGFSGGGGGGGGGGGR